MKKGLFIVLEGIDGSGTSTQMNLLHDHIRKMSRHVDILTTHEPWRSEEINRKLKEDRDAYSDGEQMALLYTKDGWNHSMKLISPNLHKGVIVISDRYRMSTFAYQGVQGVSLEKIAKMHEGILVPDVTYFLDVKYETARERLMKRGGNLEKFENNEIFTRGLIEYYRELAQRKDLFGEVVVIDGNESRKNVAGNIAKEFDKKFGNYFL